MNKDSILKTYEEALAPYNFIVFLSNEVGLKLHDSRAFDWTQDETDTDVLRFAPEGDPDVAVIVDAPEDHLGMLDEAGETCKVDTELFFITLPQKVFDSKPDFIKTYIRENYQLDVKKLR